MPLDPDLEAFLDLVKATPQGSRMSEMQPREARAVYDVSTSALDGPGADVQVETLSVPTRDGSLLPARLYLGGTQSSALPTLLFFHGGGYVLGGLDSHDSLCRDLAARTPCAVLAVAYRLAPEHQFPTAFEDAEDASLWLLEQGSAHQLDPARSAFGGDSVGGTLATALTIAAREAGRAQPLLQVLLYPCTQAFQDSASHHEYRAGYLLEHDTLQWMFRQYLRRDDDRLDWRFAPLQAPDLGGLADAHIIVAEYDPLRDEGLAYAQRLQEAGVRVQVDLHEGMVHDFARLGNVTSRADQVRYDIAHKLARAFDIDHQMAPKDGQGVHALRVHSGTPERVQVSSSTAERQAPSRTSGAQVPCTIRVGGGS